MTPITLRSMRFALHILCLVLLTSCGGGKEDMRASEAFLNRPMEPPQKPKGPVIATLTTYTITDEDSLGYLTYQEEYNRMGWLVSDTNVSDQHGTYFTNRNTYKYDENGLKTQFIRLFFAEDKIDRTITNYTYHPNGLMKTSRQTNDIGVEKTIEYIYDDHGNVIKERLYTENRLTTTMNTAYTYDSMGHVAVEKRSVTQGDRNFHHYRDEWRRNAKGEPLEMKKYEDDELVEQQLFHYNKTGNLVRKEIDYPKLRLSEREDNQFDAKNRVIKTTHYDHRDKADLTTTYRYNQQGNLVYSMTCDDFGCSGMRIVITYHPN